jgi:hypothetical protein
MTLPGFRLDLNHSPSRLTMGQTFSPVILITLSMQRGLFIVIKALMAPANPPRPTPWRMVRFGLRSCWAGNPPTAMGRKNHECRHRPAFS